MRDESYMAPGKLFKIVMRARTREPYWAMKRTLVTDNL